MIWPLNIKPANPGETPDLEIRFLSVPSMADSLFPKMFCGDKSAT